METDNFKKIKKFWTEWRFGFLLAGLLIAFELLIAGILVFSAPPGYQWTGTEVFNTGDIPVYLSYIAQAQHSPLLLNLYNDQPQITRFDAFWSIGGQLTKTGLTPIQVHEILRWFCTIILAMAVWATAKKITSNHTHARITALLILAGLSTGWLYSIWMGLFNSWAPTSLDPPDLATEFAIAPVLVGGAHMILSIALQLLIIRWIWEALKRQQINSLFYSCLGLFYIAFFHPYYIPLYGLIVLFNIFFIYKNTHLKELLLKGLLIIGCMIPGTLYYIRLIFKDPGFKTHHLQINILPIDPWYFWVIMLWPFAIAIYWTIKRKNTPEYVWQQNYQWILIWIIAALICIALPLPWSRKYTQALLPALILITLPFWLNVFDKLKNKNIILPLKIAMIIFLAFPYIHLLQTQIFMIKDPKMSKFFYTDKKIIAVFKDISIRENPDDIIITTNLWTNYLAPAYTLKHIWIGHNHETPNYDAKLTDYNIWLNTSSSIDFNNFLLRNNISIFVTTERAFTIKTDLLIDKKVWHNFLNIEQIQVWKKIDLKQANN